MRRLAWVLVAVMCVLCAGAGAHRFAGMTSGDAADEARAVVRSFAPNLLTVVSSEMHPRLSLFSVSQDRDSQGRHAWLAVFRSSVRGDAACVWVRRTPDGPWPYAYEETPSVANGRTPERVHDRCVDAVLRRDLLEPEPVTGAEMPIPAHSYPEPISPLGPVARGSYLADLELTDWASLSGVPARWPQNTAAGTSGLAGFVIDERTWRGVPRATISVTPSTQLSGFHRLPPPPADGLRLRVTADRHGGFVILNVPARTLGYDLVVTAPGYAAAYHVHELNQRGLFAGDLHLARTPRFQDNTPGPLPCGTSCSG